MRSKGFEFENKAKHYLQSKGLKLVLQNYSCRLGEIDLIML
ncbi:YraN family protein, partial [Oleiphilus sp. HI0079]